jgi:predicted dehydrogenase/threonine dehydrogenase-like Zn-dependent dehydrogenase
MKQLVQYGSSGEIRLVDVPVPRPKPRQILVRTLASAVSTGTERGNLDFAKANIVEKARRRPDLVAKVVTKSLQEGPLAAYREASARLDEPFPLGYSSAGVVEALGTGAESFVPGQLVACSGARFATHAELVAVPETMCAAVPEGVGPDDAAFSALAAVVIHGMRRGEVVVGSRVAIVGLGLLGLLAVQIAKASGAIVIGADISPERCSLASSLGADLCTVPDEGAAETVRAFCGEAAGADVVLVTATSKTNEPFVWAGEIARERGTLVVIGNFPPEIPRRYGYDKELTIEFSRAWGPGTYDPEFQHRGHRHGYPPSLVRWTAPSNMRTYLELVAAGSVSAEPLITHRFPFERATEAYQVLEDPTQSPLGILISYPPRTDDESKIEPARTSGAATAKPGKRPRRIQADTVRLGIIGAGNHVTSALMPAFSSVGRIEVRGISAPSGLTAAHVASKYGIPRVFSDATELILDDDIDAIVVATRHDSHTELAIKALSAGKHVWVEKPLALDFEGIDAIESAAEESGCLVLVGFNRRFSPLTRGAIQYVRDKGGGPFYIVIRANPGPLESGHWVLDPIEGGGRLLSEGCHYFDLACALAEAAPTAITAAISEPEGEARRQGFQAFVEFADGSLASISYAGSGPRSFGRERFEIIGTARAAAVLDFRTLYKSGKFATRPQRKLSSQKGFKEMASYFASACAGEVHHTVMNEMFCSSRLTVAAQESARVGAKLHLDSHGRIMSRPA